MPNPHLTYCPACGVPGLAHDPKKAKCPACDLELYFNPATAVCALILNPKNELLVVIRGHEPQKGMWDLPGGFVDPGETAEQAMRREIYEELSITPQDLSYLCSAANNRYLYKGITYQTTDLAFVGAIQPRARIRVADDVQDFLWVALKDIDLTRFGFDSIRQVVRHYARTVGLKL